LQFYVSCQGEPWAEILCQLVRLSHKVAIFISVGQGEPQGCNFISVGQGEPQDWDFAAVG
jgi:hypothetical protein